MKTEICSNFKVVFEVGVNTFRLVDTNYEPYRAPMAPCEYVINSKRIGLNSVKAGGAILQAKKYRYVVFPSLKLKNKMQIAGDMKAKYNLSNAEINIAMGSKFL